MSVNSISSAMAASVYTAAVRNKLPDWLLSKLVDEGIDPSTVETVSQAKTLVQNAEETNNEEEQDTDAQNQDESPELRKKAEDLAEKVGVKVRDTDTLDDIIDDIQDVLDKAMKIAVARNDEGLFNKIKGYQGDLNDIETQNNGGGISNSIIYSFMDMVAEQNKYALKLNERS